MRKDPNSGSSKSSGQTQQSEMELVTVNLSRQVDHSQAIFKAIKELGQLVKEEKLSDSGSRSLEQIMTDLFHIAKALSDEAFETGTAVTKFAARITQ